MSIPPPSPHSLARVPLFAGLSEHALDEGEASATTGLVLAIEAESLLPEVESTAPVVSQEDCCGVQRSGGAQVWFQTASAGDHFTLAFAVPQSGAYDLSAFYLRAPDYGIHTVALDGAMVGEPFDGYGPGVVLSDRVSLGNLELSAGQHMLTFTVTGTNSASSGFFVGVDLVELELVD